MGRAIESAAMKTDVKHILGIALSCSAAALALCALPVIASSASTSHVQMSWEARAMDMLSSENTLFADQSALTRAKRHSLDTPLTAAQRDLDVMGAIPVLNTDLLAQSDYQAEQRQCMAEAIYYEARSEPLAGQKAVGEVVMNRVASKHFPASVCGVVYQGAERSTGCQFSFTCDGSLDAAPKGKAWERSHSLAAHMLTGLHKPMTRRATHYHTTQIDPHWASALKPTRIIGSHAFYRFKNRRELAEATNVAP